MSAADPFLSLTRSCPNASSPPSRRCGVISHHSERAHSKYSASGAERWFNCPGSVELSEGQLDKSSPWALEGTQAHELLEQIMNDMLGGSPYKDGYPNEMVVHGFNAASFILGVQFQSPDAEVLVETRVKLDFIHPEMFGTFDGAVIEHFGTLHVFDYKYGAGHFVSAGSSRKPNYQMLFYGIGLAHQYQWNFKKVRLWIIQPRVKGYDGPVYWELPILELKSYVDVFRKAVERVEKFPKKYVEGPWCHWCKAKPICPLKLQTRIDKAQTIFKIEPRKEI
jgi:hypothetical protein